LRRLIAVIERDIQLFRKSEVRSAEVGDVILRHLRKIDEVAYVRFASVHQSFSNLEGFREVLRVLAPRGRKGSKARKGVKK
ncbi:MAG: hypothetical protein Q7S02_01640, partial [bacterium]|nr:hypothetical protein [bacterium]